MTSGALTPQEAGRLANACLDNSQSLLNDARVLLAAGSYPSAIAWAVLASEEYGKALLCCSAVAIRADDQPAWHKFWQDWRTHPSKLELASGQLIDLLVAGLPRDKADKAFRRAYAELPAHVLTINRWKQAAIYVDWQDRKVMTPSAEEAETRTFVDQVEVVIRAGRELYADPDLGARWEQNAPAMQDFRYELLAARQAGDSERAVTAVEQLLRD